MRHVFQGGNEFGYMNPDKLCHATLPRIFLDANVPMADLLRPEDDTLHSTTDMTVPTGSYCLFAVIVKAEEERFYACIKAGGLASDKW